jgi:Ala-tRNA(Pro) deacylase
MNNPEKTVELIIDQAVWDAAKVQGHPLRNTATVSITHATLAAFLTHVGHVPRVLRVP